MEDVSIRRALGFRRGQNYLMGIYFFLLNVSLSHVLLMKSVDYCESMWSSGWPLSEGSVYNRLRGHGQRPFERLWPKH